MDALRVLTTLVMLVHSPRQVQEDYFQARAEQTKRENSLLDKDYGTAIAFLIKLLYPEMTKQYEIVDKNVLKGGDKDIGVFRQTITDESNMTAVGGAIIAQVAITGLSLPYLSSTHWTARAFLLLATVSGCLSVVYACDLQRTIGRLYKPALVKEWLSLPFPADQVETSELAQRASIAAIFRLEAPFAMVQFSIFSYLTGLAIYQGLVYAKNLDTDTTKTESRNSFIALMVGTGCSFAFFLGVSAIKDTENTLSSLNAIRGNAWSVDHNQQGQIVSLEDRHIVVDGLEENGGYLSRPSVNRREPTASLTQALQDAAEAHRRCAEADLRVANEFTALMARKPTPSEGDP